MRLNITEGEVPFRKAYLRSLIDIVEVDQLWGALSFCRERVTNGRAENG